MNDLDSIRVMIESDETKQENTEVNSGPCQDWNEYDKDKKILFLITSFIKLITLVFLLYLFLISLELISIGTILITPRFLKFVGLLRHLFSCPVNGLCFGILVTSILQNAAITTSILITMVGTGLISSVKNAIPVIMGSNIGTCVTSSYVALTLSDDPLKLGRAFAAATLNDMFNILTTLILFPAEIFFNILSNLSEKIVKLINFEEKKLLKELNIIEKIQTPITNFLIQIDKDELNHINNESTIALRYCEQSGKNFSKECNYLAMPLIKNYGDSITGLIILMASTIFLLIIFFCIVKTLSLIIVGPIALWVRRSINPKYPSKFKWLTHLMLFIIAIMMTLIVQSSNIISATLVPLCGMGIMSLQRVYIMIMGSNIGTTITGILSAFSQPGSALKKSLQLAFVYTLFNIFGVILWLPVPFMRLPKKFASKLGNIAYNHHWFILTYISLLYYIIPLVILLFNFFSLSHRLLIVLIVIIVCFKIFLIYTLIVKYCFVSLPDRIKCFFKFESVGRKSSDNKSYESKYGRVLRRFSSVDLG